MADIVSWSPIDDNNNAAPPDGWPEGQMPSTVNNAGRAMMGGVRRWYDTVTAQIASLTTALGNYLPLTGGSLSGTLSAPQYYLGGVVFANSDGTTSHIFDGTGGNAIHLQAAANFYDADTHTFRNNAGAVNLLTLDGSGVTLNGAVIHFMGSTGSINTTGGPLLYADTSNHVYKQGSGSGSWLFQNYAGTNVATIGPTGVITAPSFVGNVTVPASGPISTGGTVTGGTITSAGNITAPSGTVSGAAITSSGGMTAAGTITAAQLTSTANINAAGTLTAAYIHSTGYIQADSDVYCSLLRGGNGNDSGVLRTAPTSDPVRHTLAFGWDSTDPTLYEVIDNSFTAMIPWSETIKSIKIQADGGAPAGWHLAVFTGGLINYIYSDVASDARLKRDVADSAVDALAALCAVPVRRYEWRDEVQELFGVRQGPVAIGLVAQELLPHMPDCVGISGGREKPYPEDTHTIMHERMSGYFVRAIQQLAAENAGLEARVAALEHRGGG